MATERWYLDTSAALKLVVDEGTTSMALAEAIDAAQPALLGTRLLETEMRRAANRIPELEQELVTEFLTTVELYSMTDGLFRQAGALDGIHLRSLDALHLAAALALDVERVLTYDARMAESAASYGLAVYAPGVSGGA